MNFPSIYCVANKVACLKVAVILRLSSSMGMQDCHLLCGNMKFWVPLGRHRYLFLKEQHQTQQEALARFVHPTSWEAEDQHQPNGPK